MKIYQCDSLEQFHINPQIKASVIDVPSPINTLGQLRKALENYPDDTIVSVGLVPMWIEGKTPEVMGHRRAHRLAALRSGELKNGRSYICFVSGQDITDKIWIQKGLDIENDTNTDNKETHDK